MKHILVLVTTFLILSACKQSTPQTKEDSSRLPDTISSIQSNMHKRIPGTKIYALVPQTYSFSDARNRYQKTENTFIQVVETPSARFENAKMAFSRENIESGGVKVDIVRDVKFNEFEGIFLDGPANTPDRRKASLVFGDDDFICLVFGEYPSDSPDDRTEIIQIFKSMVYNKSEVIEEDKNAFYDFDLSITGFKPAVLSDAVNIYNVDGDPQSERTLPTSMNFAPIPVLPDEAQRLYFEQLIEESQGSPLVIKPAKSKKTTINGLAATVVETTVSSEGKTGIFYAAILNGQNSALVFISSAFDDPSLRISQFKSTLQSIHFK